MSTDDPQTPKRRPGAGLPRPIRTRVEALSSAWRADDEALAACEDADTVFYTPEIVNTPRSVEGGVTRLCTSLRNVRDEPSRRAEKAAVEARADEDRRRHEEIMLRMDWFSPRPPKMMRQPRYPYIRYRFVGRLWNPCG